MVCFHSTSVLPLFVMIFFPSLISFYIQNEPLSRLVLQYMILIACSSCCLPTVPIIAVMQNLYSQSLYEKQLVCACLSPLSPSLLHPPPETLMPRILLKLISAILDLVNPISAINDRGINSVHLFDLQICLVSSLSF